MLGSGTTCFPPIALLRQLFNRANDNSHFPSAERLAMGKELSEHILALNPPQRDGGFKYLSYGAVAQYYYESGNKDRAIELVEVALNSLAVLSLSPTN